jgi:hypothetical protein
LCYGEDGPRAGAATDAEVAMRRQADRRSISQVDRDLHAAEARKVEALLLEAVRQPSGNVVPILWLAPALVRANRSRVLARPRPRSA